MTVNGVVTLLEADIPKRWSSETVAYESIRPAPSHDEFPEQNCKAYDTPTTVVEYICSLATAYNLYAIKSTNSILDELPNMP